MGGDSPPIMEKSFWMKAIVMQLNIVYNIHIFSVMLTALQIQQIARLYEANMAAMMHNMGIAFSLDKRVADIKDEIGKGERFITVERNGSVVAYLWYSVLDNALKIKSIQLAPFAGRYVLRALLSETVKAAASENFDTVRSKVYVDNHASIRLHEKLGFEETQRADGVIVFAINRQQLNTALSCLGILRQ